MESGLINTLIHFAQSHPVWLVVMAFVFAFFESLAVIGLLIPGIVLLFIVGAVVSGEPALFAWCWVSASAGALAGDVISHWIGLRYRDRVSGLWILRHRPELLDRARDAVSRHGPKGLFLGRMLGPLRPLTPLVAGMMDMPRRTLLKVAIPACIVWSPLYLVPGVLFGASLELAAEFAGRLVVVLVIVVLGTWLVIWLTQLIYNFTARRSGWWLRNLIRWSSEHSWMGRLVAPVFETGPGRRELISVALLGLLLVICLALLLGVLVAAPFASGAWDAERQVAGWAASMRNHVADPFFIVVSMVGDLRVMALVASLMAVLMVAIGRGNAAAHWLAATAGGWLLAEMLNGTVGLMLQAPDSMPSLGELPHRGLTLTTVVLGFFAVMIAKDVRASRRKWPYLANTVALALIGFAHFYLGRASVSGLLAAYALGGGWLALVGIAYRQRALLRRHPARLALVFYVLVVAVGAGQIAAGYPEVRDATRLTQPERTLTLHEWLGDGWRSLPARRSRLGRLELQRFDFQFAGSVDALSGQLEQAGWQRPASRSGGWRALFTVRPQPETVPHLPRDFAGHPEKLIMTYGLDSGDKTVLRLWGSGTTIASRGDPVWLGQVRIERIDTFLGILNRWATTEEDDRAMRLLADALPEGRMRKVTEEMRLIRLD